MAFEIDDAINSLAKVGKNLACDASGQAAMGHAVPPLGPGAAEADMPAENTIEDEMTMPVENVRQIEGPVSHMPVQSESAAVLSMIERVARDPAVDIDKLERLMKMHREAVERASRVAFDAALAEMQPELPAIDRKGRIEVRAKGADGQRNGAIQQNTPYALWEDINEAIKPILHKYGFSLSFRAGTAPDGKVTVTGILSHNGGHRESDTFTLQHDSTGSKNAVQAVGSSNSYGKRYTAINLLNITTRGQDDDGIAAGAHDTINSDQIGELTELIDSVRADKVKFLRFFKVESLSDLPSKRFPEAVTMLNAKSRG